MICHIKAYKPEAQFCAVVQTRPSLEFIKNQPDIKYSSILFDEDVHRSLYSEKIDYDYLRLIEKEYGIPNLLPYLHIDRVIMNGQLLREYPHDRPTLSHENMLRDLQVTAKAIIEFLDRERPDAVVISVVGALASTLLYHIAQKKGVQVINIEIPRMGNRIIFSEDDRTFTWAKKLFDEIEGGRVSKELPLAKKFLDEFRANPAPYDAQVQVEFYGEKDRLTALRFLKPRRLLRSVPWYVKTFFQDIRKRKNNDYEDIYVWWTLWDKMKRTGRSLIGFADLCVKPDWDQKFAYFPLHCEPEIAISRYAPYYANQLELIRAVAHALPIDFVLYVKEHPGMVGYRKRSFYKEIIKIPNVRLIDPNIPGDALAQRSSLTTVITSTSGWESLLFGIPVITFGDAFFNDIPGVTRCHSFEDLPYIIKEQLEHPGFNEQILLNYMSALIEDSVPVDFNEMWNKATSFEIMVKDQGIIKLSHFLADKISFAKENRSTSEQATPNRR